MNLGVTAAGALNARRTNAVYFVHEDDRGCVFAGHDEEFAHHATALADVFLYQLGAADSNELAVGVMGDGACQ